MPVPLVRFQLRYPLFLESTVLQWVATYGYVAIFSLLVFGIVGLPVPDEFLLTGCGFLVYQGHLQLVPTVLQRVGGQRLRHHLQLHDRQNDGLEVSPLARRAAAAHHRRAHPPGA